MFQEPKYHRFFYCFNYWQNQIHLQSEELDAKLHNFFLNKFLEESKEILKKLQGSEQWQDFEIEHFPEISRTSLPISFCYELQLWGVYNRLIYISPPTF